MSDIRVIKRVIEEQCAEIRSMKNLARFTVYSIETIRKDFVRSENNTLAAFVRNKRVDEAKRLLTRTYLSFQMICHWVGFSREEVGETVFKRLTGMTMVEHRRQSRVKETKGSFKLSATISFAKVVQLNPIINFN